MIAELVGWSARHARAVIGVTVLLALAGALGGRGLARDIVPDLADARIAVVATWMGHPATQVESNVTQVLTQSLGGLRGSTATRAVSMAGMAYVDVVFGDASDLERGHRDVADRVARARALLPPGVRVEVGPAVSSTSWVFQYALSDPTERVSPLALRRLQDDVLRPALAALPGVAQVASLGGGAQQVRVEVEAELLEAHALAFTDVAGAVRAALDAAALPDLDALRKLGIRRRDGASVPLDQVANVTVDDEMPSGVADLGGEREAVGGIVLARSDAELFSLVAAVRRTLASAQLPPTVECTTVYDRTELAGRANGTLARALGEEIVVAVIVVYLFLLHARSALVPLVTLPVVLFLTFGAMWIVGVPSTIMSLGGIGIALGMAVDADIVALEACNRKMEEADHRGDEPRRRSALVAAASTLAPAVATSLALTAVAFLPAFTFPVEAGRLLRPLALTKTLVVASAALVSLTFSPALRDRLLRGRVTPEFENGLTRRLVNVYRPMVRFALSRPALTIATAAFAVASCLPIAGRLGGEFLPNVDEGDLLFMPTTLPGVRPERAAAQMRQQDRAIAAFPEVQTVFGKIGRADTATDPAPYSMAETIVRLKPRSTWPAVARARWYSSWAPPRLARVLGTVWPEQTTETPAELVEALNRATQRPGWTNAWTAPARARMQMMSTGIRTAVGVRVVAADPARLESLGAALQRVVSRLGGARSVVFESLGGEARLGFEPDPDALARHAVDPAAVTAAAELVVSGGQLGEMRLAGRPLRVRLAPETANLRGPADELRDVTVRATDEAGGHPVPMGLLGRPRYEATPAMIRTEDGERVAYLYVDLEEGVDPVGYVERARRTVDAAVAGGEIVLGPQERIEWAGQHRLFAAAARQFKWIAAAVAVLVVALLALQLRSISEALIVAASVPFALVGSIWTLFWLGYPLSPPVWVGLLSVVGLATQTGVVVVVFIDQSFYARVRAGTMRTREDVVEAHAEGTIRRLRPKIMTVTTLAAALLPLLWSEGAGAEIIKRVAAPMVGGIVTSALLTLEVLPVVYTLWRCRQLERSAIAPPVDVCVQDPFSRVAPSGPSGTRPPR